MPARPGRPVRGRSQRRRSPDGGRRRTGSRPAPQEGRARSRAYLNGSIASAEALDEATAGAVEIIGQHDQLTITRPARSGVCWIVQLDGDGESAREAYRRRGANGLVCRPRALGGDPRLGAGAGVAEHDAETISTAAVVDRTRTSGSPSAREGSAMPNRSGRWRRKRRDRSNGRETTPVRRSASCGASARSTRPRICSTPSTVSRVSWARRRAVWSGCSRTSTRPRRARGSRAPSVGPRRPESPLRADGGGRHRVRRQPAGRAEELASLLERADRIDEELAAAEQQLREPGRRCGSQTACRAPAGGDRRRPPARTRLHPAAARRSRRRPEPGPGGADTADVVRLGRPARTGTGVEGGIRRRAQPTGARPPAGGGVPGDRLGRLR
jgi:hypothetical protein